LLKKIPHPAVFAGHVKPIEIGGTRISTSGKSFDFPSEDSGGSLEMRVGPTTPQITNSAGKKHILLSRTSRVVGSRCIKNTGYYHVFTSKNVIQSKLLLICIVADILKN